MTGERIMLLLATGAMLGVNGLAATGRINGTSPGAVAALYDVPFTPAGYVFSIWGLIYLALLAFSVWQLTAEGVRSARAAALRPVYVFSVAANVAWLWFWHHEAVLAALVVMLLLLASLVAAYRILSAGEPGPWREALCLDAPFSLYLGWISVAALANLSVVVASGVLRFSVDPLSWSLLMIGCVLALGAFAFARLRDPLFLAVISWAAAGIALKGGQAPLVSAPAMIVAGLSGLGVISLLLGAGRGGLLSRARADPSSP